MATKIEMPAVAAGVEAATLVQWLKNEGDAVVKGEAIAEVETDKAVMEMEAPSDGTLGRVLVHGGTDAVAVGTLIGVLLESGDDPSVLDEYGQDLGSSDEREALDEVSLPEQDSPRTTTAETAEPDIDAGKAEGRIFASPLARRLADEGGISLQGMSGSGPHGRIVRLDIERALEQSQGSAKKPHSPTLNENSRVEHVSLDSMRKTIAARLTESKQEVPHFYLTVDCRMERLSEVRARLNQMGSEATGSRRVSVNDVLVYAVAKAMRKVPEVNASWAGNEILRYMDVDISVAVATERGLITPVIREADRKGVHEISDEIQALAARAKSGSLGPSEYQGGGLSISNLGMYGIKDFSAIINPPQASILAVGAVERRPVVENDALEVGSVMTMTLSADHRVIDGAVGARFLSELRALLEEPLGLLA